MKFSSVRFFVNAKCEGVLVSKEDCTERPNIVRTF